MRFLNVDIRDVTVQELVQQIWNGEVRGAVMYVLQEAFENEECLLELEMRNEKLGIERELPQIIRELKEIGPQADEDGEQQLFASSSSKSKFFTHCQYKEEFIKLKQVSASGQQLSKKYYPPWMICEPNEKEGRRLLAEIMQGGNFGQYDTRNAALRKEGWKIDC